MLIYEKVGTDSKRHLFGSTTGIPASTDTQVTYLDNDSVAITDLTVNTQLVDDGAGGIERVSNGKAVNVMVGSVNVIPGNFTPAAKAASKKAAKVEVKEPEVEVEEDEEAKG